MKIINAAKELKAGNRKVCLAIGFFDGVHLGHQQIIRQTITDARQHEALALVITFDRHPNAIVAPGRVPPLIYPLAQKLRVIEAFGAEALLLIRFDEGFSRLTGEAFIRGLTRSLGGLKSVCVGADFTFGHKRGGNVALLKELGRELQFAVHGMAAVSLNGRVVSSTRIREAIQAGQLDLAGQMLGRGYAIFGTVMAGDRLGRQIGFPTANLDVSGLVLPPSGVYAAHVSVRGQTHPAVLNIGHRPTLKQPDPPLRVEAHLLDFDADLYGEEMEVCVGEVLRGEMKFDSLEQLRAQIARDIARTRAQFL